jgi:small subunit ribosomal protein S4
MARNLEAKEKLSRKIGRNLFSKGARSFSAKAAVVRRPYKPGQHGKTSGITRLSEYGKQLQEKQIIKHVYGLLERQFRKIYTKALSKKGDTSHNLLLMLETRLDNVVLKGGLAESKSQARQLVNHGHFLLNGKPVNIPSIQVKPGDQISLKESKKKSVFWQNFSLTIPSQKPTWLQVDETNKKITVVTEPLAEDLPTNFKTELVIELYSR